MWGNRTLTIKHFAHCSINPNLQKKLLVDNYIECKKETQTRRLDVDLPQASTFYTILHFAVLPVLN
jgi:hypothetical protein